MYLYAMYVYLAPCYKTAFLYPSIRVLMYTLHVCVLSTSRHVYNEQRGVCVYTRTTRREIRIIGSNDGSQGTGAGKSQRLSLLVTHHPFSSLFVSVPFLSLSFFIFLLFLFFLFFFFGHDVNPTRQKQQGVHRKRSPGSLFSSVVLRTRSHSVPLFLSPFVRSSDCSVYCASRTIPGKKKSTTKKCSCGRGRVLAPCCRAACRASAFDRSLTLVRSAMFYHFLRLLLGNEPPTRINQSYSTGKKI